MGRLVAAVDELGLKERTLILFIGDNGTSGRGKGEMTERGVRVPFIARGPGTVKAGVVARALTDITDVFPTLADFAGAVVPAGHPLDGKSLTPVLRGEASRHRDWIFSFRNRGRLIRDQRWLLELDAEKGQERFYDCGETRDGRGYQLVSDSTSPEVVAARVRLDQVLQNLPSAESFPGLITPETNSRKAKRAAKLAKEDP
jgi:arylsulfatase A